MILSSPPAFAELYTLPEGAAGTRATLRLMSRLVKAARIEPTIRSTASDLVMGNLPGDYRGEAESCFLFVRDSIRYLQDTADMQVVNNPLVTLSQRSGNCVQKSVLLSSLLESIGHPCRFVALGYSKPGDFEHVFTETRIGQQWVAADPTMSVSLGWAPEPPDVPDPIICRMVEHI